jgi:hypothetical protein
MHLGAETPCPCSILIYQDDPDEHAEETHMLSTSRTLLGMYFLNK